MKKLLSFFVCTLIVLMFVVTCPDKQKHQEVIKSSLSERFDKKLSEDSSTSSLFSLLGSVITTNILDVFLSSELRVDNYFLFSLGIVSWQGEEKTVSLGVLNHVFTFFSDKEKEELRNME